ncbi:ArsR family transcriptional regulator [Alkalibaculum sp. M08DMB]|uniref:ArsR family transcriptional regulator n=1 Tax=Alkalibaculum sporogenes TaxID=2655001 RepID=A0A6A7K9B8_9FIRM|nr:ArsR family transcriptional regulator [Alkalibaculum sporogenes]MPW25703.1 ArsR family transcriptional regulator [Alkalibaculum sporogenes]
MDKFVTHDIFKYELIAQALSNYNRLKILDLLKDGDYNINHISKTLKMPMPTVTVNIQKLEESGLIICTSKSGKHGKQKICSLKYRELTLKFFDEETETYNIVDTDFFPSIEKNPSTDLQLTEKIIDVKLGSYNSFKVSSSYGMASANELIEKGNALCSFSSDEKNKCEVLWFNDGFITYDIPIDIGDNILDSLNVSFEMCSEHMFFNNNWPSDISLWINSVELGTYTSEGYFGDKGILTPSWWPIDKPQHGELISFKVDNIGTYINEKIFSALKIKELIVSDNTISIKIGIKKHAKNSRGIMIFGEQFGNHKQNINVHVVYKTL